MRFAMLDALRAWLDRLAAETDLVGPRNVDGHILYRPVSSGGEVVLDFQRPELSAKDHLLPATEILLEIEQHGQDVALEEVLPKRTQVVFGIRPCDAHGLAAIDALFLEQDPPDLHYQRQRERTTLVGLACAKMWEGCFCTSVGGAPDDASHVDVLLRAADGGYGVEPVTEKGEAILEGLASEERKGEVVRPQTDAELVPTVPPDKWRPLFDHEMWMRHGERCLSCRICTYACPTCRCFDVAERVTAVRAGSTYVERIRVWDACTGTNYRRVAGGHNPRPTKPERLRIRFICKFCYYPEDFDPLGCVGCGRCIVSCPVDIDITEVLRDVAERSGG